MDILKRNHKELSALKRMSLYLKPYTARLIFIFGLYLVFGSVSIIRSMFMVNLINSYSGKTIRQIVTTIMLLCFFIALEMFFQIASNRKKEFFRYDFDFMFKNKIADKVNRLKIEYIDEKNSSNIINTVNRDYVNAYDFIMSIVLDLPFTVVNFLFSLVWTLYLNWTLAIISLLLVPVISFFIAKISKRTEKYTRIMVQNWTEYFGLARDAFEGHEVIKAFNLQDHVDKKLDPYIEKGLNASKKMNIVNSTMEPLNQLVSNAPLFTAASVGGLLTIAGKLSIGALISFIDRLNYLTSPMREYKNYINSYRSAKISAERFYEFFDAAEERSTEDIHQDHAQGESAEGTAVQDEYDVVFEDVCFNYIAREELLTNLSFKIKKGDMVAISGHSGCGKSTIMKLASALYEPKSGDIRICGKSIYRYPVEEIRKNISVVTQDSYLFPGSIRYNLEIVKPGVVIDEIKDACEKAGILEFIESLPEKFDTDVGERGNRFSGGQRQRICIARALLKNAPFLILDEPTSSLDYITENEIQEALEVLMKGRTVLVIAHRLSTIRNSDVIFCMENGRIVETGTHDELMARKGVYADLYAMKTETGNANKEVALEL